MKLIIEFDEDGFGAFSVTAEEKGSSVVRSETKLCSEEALYAVACWIMHPDKPPKFLRTAEEHAAFEAHLLDIAARERTEGLVTP